MDELAVIAPPDGGWGWVVVFASFMIHIVGKTTAYQGKNKGYKYLVVDATILDKLKINNCIFDDAQQTFYIYCKQLFTQYEFLLFDLFGQEFTAMRTDGLRLDEIR